MGKWTVVESHRRFPSGLDGASSSLASVGAGKSGGSIKYMQAMFRVLYILDLKHRHG